MEDLRLKRYYSFPVLLVLIPLCLFAVQNTANASQAIILVPDDYATIQAAIDAANPGDAINVRNGTYSENIVLSKSLLLIGENAETTIVDGGQVGGWVLEITADNTTVVGFTLRSLAPTRNLGLGIYANNCTVSKNVIANNRGGIQLRGDSNVLSENTVTDNEFYGINVDSSSNNNISRNDVRGGIRLSDSSGNSLTENNCDGIALVFSSNNNNLTGNVLVDGGLSVFSSFGTVTENNSVNGKPLIYLEGASGQLIEDAGQVILVSCTDMLIRNLTNADIELYETNNTEITANHEAIAELFAGSNNNTIIENKECTIRLDSSSNNYITSNRVSNNSDGIYLAASWNNYIGENNLTTNNNGIRLISSSNNTVTQNQVMTNTYSGIDLSFSSSSNRITWNNISDNDIGVYLSYSSNDNDIFGNSITENQRSGITIGYRVPESGPEQGGCSATKIFENGIVDNGCGIQITYSSNTTIFNNNFQQNSVQTYTDHSSNTRWDEGYPTGGNCWSDYYGTDSDYDGIGDTPYFIDANNQDNYPLMGMFSEFNVFLPYEKTENVTVISNSTVSNLSLMIWLSSPYNGLQPGQPFIQFTATGENGSVGFCRLMIPRTVLNSSSYIVLVDSNPVNATELPVSNSTHVYLYFTYAHSTHEVIVTIPEFPSCLVLSIFMAATLLAAILCKRKRSPNVN